MLALFLGIIVICLIAGGVGLAVHPLIWLFWVALIILIGVLIVGALNHVFTRGRGRSDL